MSYAKLYAGLFGAVYALVGVVGLLIPGGTMISPAVRFIVFDLNLLHSLTHLLVGALGLAAYAGGEGASRLYARVMGVAFLALALLGIADPLHGLLPIGGVDVLLHAATAALALYVGFVAPAARQRQAAMA